LPVVFAAPTCAGGAVADEDSCHTLVCSPDPSWSRQSTEVPASDFDSIETMSAGETDERFESEALLDEGEDLDDDEEDEQVVQRLRLAARRLALGRMEDDDGEVDEEDVDRACHRMAAVAQAVARLPRALPCRCCAATPPAPDRLVRGSVDEEGEESDEEEVDLAVARMGLFARTYALTAGKRC